MTMLAMWLGEKLVALATDSKMAKADGSSVKVDKLHIVQTGRTMFAIGFGAAEVFCWLTACPYGKDPYPEHWRDCSQAKNVDDLELIIKDDLQSGGFPSGFIDSLELWVAGLNEQGTLEAFVLNGAGHRVKQLLRDEVFFNRTSKMVCAQHEMTTVKNTPSFLWPQLTKTLWQPERRFWTLKKLMEEKGIELPGARALEETCGQLIDFCEKNNNPWIGGPLQYHVIRQS